VEVEFIEDQNLSFWERVWASLRAQVTGIIRPREGTKMIATLSAYSPRAVETDSTPCIGARGRVFRGMVASNFLPKGTQLRIEGGGLAELLDIEPDQFYIGDSMNDRYGRGFMDIWVPKTQKAREFGRRRLEVQIVRYIPQSDVRRVLAEKFNAQFAERHAPPTPTPKVKAQPKPTRTPEPGEELAVESSPGLFEGLQTSLQRAFGFLSARVGITQEVDCFAPS
ncbi:MAG: hypothetical protein G01um1014106_316, partial [Parcubacteria group bacterium Gr01-1014_106]